MNTIMLVDDHPVFRCGMATLIRAEPDLTICAEAASVDEALPLINQHQPDLLILDLVLAEGDGLQLIKHLRTQGSKLPILVMSMYDERLFAERVLRAGANGFINKADAISNIIPAIRRVLKGRIYVSEQVSELLITANVNGKNSQGSAAETKLSDREMEIYMMLGRGYSTKRIAKELHLSPKTIDSHKEHIKEKLNITDNNSLIQRAVTWMMSN
ncbi:response regulator transcription factor [Rheinheimera sp.]|uniref:response regulator n=1 Tax=Rheinheimera sp. TaxID=1869214 RepID=UPI002732DB2A|nr:response regulator transcription factor [Rheinheimera sp.]MDP2715472.1 response regulator transcription factor [Rheinheimera sp.]